MTMDRAALSNPMTIAQLPMLKDHGIRRVLLTFDDGHETQAAACRALGGMELDLLPAGPGGTAKRRFTVDL